MRENNDPGKYKRYLVLLRTVWQSREDVKAYTHLLLSLVAISLFTWFAIKPTAATIIELFGQIDTQQKVLATLEKKQKDLGTARQTWQKHEQNLPIINQAIPDVPQPYLWARQIEALAGKEGLVLTNLSFEKIEISGGEGAKEKNNFSTTFTVEGPNDAAISFLGNISKTRQPIIWESLTLSGKPPGAATTLTLSVTGSMPFGKQ